MSVFFISLFSPRSVPFYLGMFAFYFVGGDVYSLKNFEYGGEHLKHPLFPTRTHRQFIGLEIYKYFSTTFFLERIGLELLHFLPPILSLLFTEIILLPYKKNCLISFYILFYVLSHNIDFYH